jgi:glycosyltransferase involved in cell wall biosynthesis
MSASVSTLTSNIGTASELIINGKNGFLCNSTEDWIRNICLLIENPILRKEIGEMGFMTVNQKYSKNLCFLELKTNFLDKI